MVSVWLTPFAVIEVGEIEVTVGVSTAAVTATDCVPDVQVPAELHTRTEMVSVTVPGFMLMVICVVLTMVGGLPLPVSTTRCRRLCPVELHIVAALEVWSR